MMREKWYTYLDFLNKCLTDFIGTINSNTDLKFEMIRGKTIPLLKSTCHI